MDAPPIVIVGGGLRGMVAGLRLRRARPETQVLVVEAEPTPARDLRTQRSNGFVCELGAFALSKAELTPALAALARKPRTMAANDDARTGWVFDGAERHATPVEPVPRSFATGCEELAQSLRRELGPALRLGRAVTSLQTTSNGFMLQLGGEVPTELQASEVQFATSATSTAALLASFDPKIPAIAQAAERRQHAFVFFGGLANETRELTGYGVVAGEAVDTPLRELIFCTNVFARRALPDRFLMRAELALPDTELDDHQVMTLAEEQMRHWTGCEAAFGFAKVHRFAVTQADGATTECGTRCTEVLRAVDGLSPANGTA